MEIISQNHQWQEQIAHSTILCQKIWVQLLKSEVKPSHSQARIPKKVYLQCISWGQKTVWENASSPPPLPCTNKKFSVAICTCSMIHNTAILVEKEYLLVLEDQSRFRVLRHLCYYYWPFDYCLLCVQDINKMTLH